MKKLAISVIALAVLANAQQQTARAIYANNGNNSIEYTNPRSAFQTPGPVTAVEGLVVTETGEVENAQAVMGGNAYVKAGNDMADGDWARVWGYVEGSVIDIASNSGMTWAVTNNKRVLFKDDSATLFNQIDPPVDANFVPLSLLRLDVDGAGKPWVITVDGEGSKSVHRYHPDQGTWERVRFGKYDIMPYYEVFPRDIACSDDGIIFVTGSIPLQFRMDNCVFAYHESDLRNAVAVHAGLAGMLPGDKAPEKQWHMVGLIDVDANGVLWSQVRRVWKTATGWNDRTCLFSTQAIDAEGNVDLSIDNDDLYLNDWWVEDIGAQ